MDYQGEGYSTEIREGAPEVFTKPPYLCMPCFCGSLITMSCRRAPKAHSNPIHARLHSRSLHPVAASAVVSFLSPLCRLICTSCQSITHFTAYS